MNDWDKCYLREGARVWKLGVTETAHGTLLSAQLRFGWGKCRPQEVWIRADKFSLIPKKV